MSVSSLLDRAELMNRRLFEASQLKQLKPDRLDAVESGMQLDLVAHLDVHDGLRGFDLRAEVLECAPQRVTQPSLDAELVQPHDALIPASAVNMRHPRRVKRLLQTVLSGTASTE